MKKFVVPVVVMAMLAAIGICGCARPPAPAIPLDRVIETKRMWQTQCD